MLRILDIAGIPLLIFAVSVFYAIKLWVTKDATSIRGKNNGKLKDEEGYAKAAAKLLLFFAAGTLVASVLLFFHLYAAVGVMLVSMIILGILWKKMNDKYGA